MQKEKPILESGKPEKTKKNQKITLTQLAMRVSFFTLLSRITGLIRENLIATIFGVSGFTDAFFVAQRLPNMLRRLFAEGAFSQAFVPILVRSRIESEFTELKSASSRIRVQTQNEPSPSENKADNSALQGTHNLINSVSTVLFWNVLLVCIIGIVLSPYIVWGVAPGLHEYPLYFEAATEMTQIMFPYLLLISMVSLSAAILNTWQQFSIPAVTPVLLNISLISSAIWLNHWINPPIYSLAIGVLIGGGIQLIIQIPSLQKINMLPKVSYAPKKILKACRDPETRALLSKMGPAILAVSVAQISLVINSQIASHLAHGSISWITYSDRLMELPIALLGTALGTVLLPSLSKTPITSSRYSEIIDWGLRSSTLLSLPCIAAFLVGNELLTAILFHYGKFSNHDLVMTGQAVQGYALGLLGLTAIKILAPAFYAQKNVKSPTKIAIVTLATTQSLNLLTVPWLQHAGLAISISLGASLNAFLLLRDLKKKGWYTPQQGWKIFCLKVSIATTAMVGFLWPAAIQFNWTAIEQKSRVLLGLGIVSISGLIYLGTLYLLRINVINFLKTPSQN